MLMFQQINTQAANQAGIKFNTLKDSCINISTQATQPIHFYGQTGITNT